MIKNKSCFEVYFKFYNYYFEFYSFSAISEGIKVKVTILEVEVTLYVDFFFAIKQKNTKIKQKIFNFGLKSFGINY